MGNEKNNLYFPSTAGIKDENTRKVLDQMMKLFTVNAEKARKNENSIFGRPVDLMQSTTQLLGSEQQTVVAGGKKYTFEAEPKDMIEVAVTESGDNISVKIRLLNTGDDGSNTAGAVKWASVSSGSGYTYTANIYDSPELSGTPIVTAATLKISTNQIAANQTLPAVPIPCVRTIDTGGNEVYYPIFAIPRWLEL